MNPSSLPSSSPSSSSRRSALLLAALASACCCHTAAAAVDATYQYYRFTPLKLRNDATANSIQIAEFTFLKSGAAVSMSGVSVTNPGGNRNAAEQPANLVDGSNATKWLDFFRNPIVFAFAEPVTIDGYRFTTANDANERDPVRWILEGSSDETNWVVLDHLQADFATPTARLTTSGDILLGTATSATAKTWNGGDPANWDTTTAAWDKGGPVTWDNASTDIARFAAGTPATVNLVEPISARSIETTAPLLIQGNTLTATMVTRINPGADLEISSVIAGSVGVIKSGPNKLTLSGANTYTGPLQSRAGHLVVSGTNASTGTTTAASGGKLTFTGAATKGTGALEAGNASGNGTIVFEQTGTLTFNGTPLVGTGAVTPGAGLIRQTAGTVSFSQDGQYLTLGNTASSYGSYELSGGTASTPNGSGIRVGFNGTGVLTQSGGSLSCGRWFAIGNANGKGVLTLTGGTTAMTNNAYRLIGGDGANGQAVINIGTALGGSGSFTAIRNNANANDGAVVLGAAAGSSGIINLNSGVLKVFSRIYRQNTVTSTGIVNFNGGTLSAGANNIELANTSLTAVRLYRGGATIHTDGNAATFAAPITGMNGNGLAFTGLPVEVDGGGSNYSGAPLVTVNTDGSGAGATAIANVTNGAVTGVTITCPGDGYAVGDTVFFDFTAMPGVDNLAASIAHTLTAGDLAPNNTGTLTKSGAGALTLNQASTIGGPVAVAGGSLVVNTSLGSGPVSVAAGATLGGAMNLTGAVSVDGTLAPGTAVGTAVGAAALNLAAGSTLALQITDWNGAAGTGYDTLDFGSIATNATSSNKLTVQVDTTGIVNFSESAHSFTIGSADAPPSGFSTDNWQVSAIGGFTGTGTWSLGVDGNNLVLSYTPAASGYGTWIAGFAGLSDSSASGDPDGDGLANVLEYVLNSNPGNGSGMKLPAAAISGENFTVSFVRRAESKGDTTQTLQYGPVLPGATEVPVPASSSGIFTITPDSPSAGLETVTATIPRGAEPQIFARLKATQP